MLLLHFYGDCSAAKVMSWAAGLETTWPEDLAYCLLGLFGVNMALIYGEGGSRDFEQLQLEFIKSSTDNSLSAGEDQGRARASRAMPGGI